MKPLLILNLFIFFSAPIFSQFNLSDTTNLEGYFDGVIETHLRDKNIAGATLAFVQDGRIKLLKGYGFSDVKQKLAVDPHNTLFRIGSISKMFTWLAIMQLLEDGKLSLEDDINSYFKDFKVSDDYPEKITVKHLMTHTPGFEDEILGLFARDSSSIKPLGEILKNEIPKRVRPPGTMASYSNHGTGMAAYIVEQIANQDFNDYVEEKIFGPLSMSRASFRQPLPDSLDAFISKGYRFDGGEFQEMGFEYVPLAPVGAASASAASMARFMLMFLNKGTLDGITVLDSVTYQLMSSPAHRHHPLVNPMRHGFMDMSQNNQTIIGHGGDTYWFHSLMALFPEHNMGLFLSFNSQAGGGTYFEVLEDFTDRYFPENLQSINPNDPEELKIFTGEYTANRYSFDDIMKLAKLMSVINISHTKEGYLKTSAGQDVDYWIKQDKLVFRNRDNSNILAFEEDENGNITHAFRGDFPIFALDKLNGIDKISLHTQIFLITTIMVVLCFLYWCISYFFRKFNKVRRDAKRALPKNGKYLAWWASFLFIVFLIGFAILFSNPFTLVYGMPTSAYFVFSLPLIIMFLTICMLYHILKIWSRKSKTSLWKKIAFSILWLCLVVSIIQWNYWNLLGFQF